LLAGGFPLSSALGADLAIDVVGTSLAGVIRGSELLLVSDKIRDEAWRKEQARMRVSTMLSLADAIGGAVSPADVRKGALVKLTPAALGSAVVVGQYDPRPRRKAGFTLAGLVDDKVLAKLLEPFTSLNRPLTLPGPAD